MINFNNRISNLAIQMDFCQKFRKWKYLFKILWINEIIILFLTRGEINEICLYNTKIGPVIIIYIPHKSFHNSRQQGLFFKMVSFKNNPYKTFLS